MIQTDGTIINMKGTKKLKEAIRQAAFKTGHPNSSQFMLTILSKNPDVRRELIKLTKKVA